MRMAAACLACLSKIAVADPSAKKLMIKDASVRSAVLRVAEKAYGADAAKRFIRSYFLEEYICSLLNVHLVYKQHLRLANLDTSDILRKIQSFFQGSGKPAWYNLLS